MQCGGIVAGLASGIGEIDQRVVLKLRVQSNVEVTTLPAGQGFRATLDCLNRTVRRCDTQKSPGAFADEKVAVG